MPSSFSPRLVPGGLLLLSLSLLLLSLPVPGKEEPPGPFLHPGLLHNRAEIDFVRGRIRAGEDPWKTAWEALKAHDLSSLTWKSRAHPHVERGPYNRPSVGANEMMRDAPASYTHALHWTLSGENEHARKAIEILDDYASVLKSVGHHDARLLVGMTGIQFLNAAELIRHGEAGWPEESQKRFQEMVRKILYPVIADFFPSANGNWDASMIQTMIAMGVFLDDRVIFNRGVNYFREGKGNGALTNYFNELGQCQESGRDQHHTQMGLGYLAYAAEIAWKQGVDLYSLADSRLAKGYEYTARYNLGHEVPFKRYRSIDGRYDHKEISKRGRGYQGPIFELAWNHYNGRLGREMPFTRQVVQKQRPEKPRGEFVPWASLMFAGVPDRKPDPGKHPPLHPSPLPTRAEAVHITKNHVRNLFQSRFDDLARNYGPQVRLMPGHDLLKPEYALTRNANALHEGATVDSAELIAAMKRAFKKPIVEPEFLGQVLNRYAFEILDTEAGDFSTPPADPVKTPDGKLHFMIREGDLLFKVGPAKPRKGDFLLFQMRPVKGSWKLVAEYLD